MLNLVLVFETLVHYLQHCLLSFEEMLGFIPVNVIPDAPNVSL